MKLLVFVMLFALLGASPIPPDVYVEISAAYDLGLESEFSQFRSKGTPRTERERSRHFLGWSDPEQWPSQINIKLVVRGKQRGHEKYLKETKDHGIFSA